MPEIRSLAHISFNEIHKAFANAFADYVEPWNKSVDEIKYMLERRGYNDAVSFGAFRNGEIVAFMLNGSGVWNGKPTAYDMGTGTIPEFRRQRWAEKIFTTALPALKTAGIEQYLLEVIRVNNNAIGLYEKQGFKITRELDYYVADKNNLVIRDCKIDVRFKQIAPDWSTFREYWNFHPSWQNSIEPIERKLNHFAIIGAYAKNELIGYGIVEKHTGDIPQFAIASAFRRQRIGTALFAQLLKYNYAADVRIINADASYMPFREFAHSLGILSGYGQYEMILDL